jgi:hypothetical protein
MIEGFSPCGMAFGYISMPQVLKPWSCLLHFVRAKARTYQEQNTLALPSGRAKVFGIFGTGGRRIQQIDKGPLGTDLILHRLKSRG